MAIFGYFCSLLGGQQKIQPSDAARPYWTIDGLRVHRNKTPGPQDFMRTNLFSGKFLEILPYMFFHQVRFPKGFFFPPKACYPKNILKYHSFQKMLGSSQLESDAFVACCFFLEKSEQRPVTNAQNDQNFPQKVSPKAGKAENNMPRVDVKPEVVSSKCEKWFQSVVSSHLKHVSLVWSFLQVGVKINIFETTTYLSKFISFIHTPGKEFEFEGSRAHYLYADVTTRYL